MEAGEKKPGDAKKEDAGGQKKPGDKGESGEEGKEGKEGEKGEAGDKGNKGQSGQNGEQGENGKKGQGQGQGEGEGEGEGESQGEGENGKPGENGKNGKGKNPGKEGKEGEGENGDGDKEGDGKNGEGEGKEKGDKGKKGKGKGDGSGNGDGESDEPSEEESDYGQIFEIYKQQQELRNQLSERLSQEGITPNEKRILSQMEQVENELLEKGFTDEVMKRMVNLKHQLFKLDKAQFQQGEDTKRKSDTNKKELESEQLTTPAQIKQYFNTTEILNRQVLPLQPEFKKKVQEYFISND